MRRTWLRIGILLTLIPVVAAIARWEAGQLGWVTVPQGIALMAALSILLGGAVALYGYRSLRATYADLVATQRDLQRRGEQVAEQAERIRQAAAEHEAFFERSVDLLAIVGFDGRFRHVNGAWTATLGYTREELVGRPFLDLVHPDDVERTKAEAGRLSGTGQAATFENRYVGKDGHVHWLRWLSSTSTDLQVFLATAKDVTSERATAQALAAAERRFRLLFEANPVAVAISRADGSGFADVNPAFEALTGYARAEVTQPGFDPQRLAVDAQARQAMLAEARGTGRVDAVEIDLLRKDGSRRTVVASLRAFDLDGRAHVLSAMQDITLRKQEQAAARRAQERFETVFHLSPVAIALTHDDGRFVDANEAFCDLVGRSRTDLLAGKANAVEMWEDPQERQRLLADIRERGLVRGRELRVLRPGGEVRTALASVEYVDAGGQTTILSLLQDVTERLRMQREREERIATEAELERLRRTERFRTEFINSTAHELATPLTPLVLNVRALAASAATLDDAQRRTVASMERNVLRLRNLVDDLVGAADLQARGIALERRRLNVTRELRAAVAAHQAAAQRAGVHLQDPHDSGLAVSADPARLQLVLGHLLGNAIKFTPPGGRIAVASRRSADEVRVEVTDTGPGLTRKQLEMLWRPFSQAHDKAQRTDSGSGLGLYVVKGIIDLHGGEVGATSPGPGQGSTFWFTLPLANGHLDPLTAPGEDPPAGRTLNPLPGDGADGRDA